MRRDSPLYFMLLLLGIKRNLFLERGQSFSHTYLIIILKNRNFPKGLDFLLDLYASDVSEMACSVYSFCHYNAVQSCYGLWHWFPLNSYRLWGHRLTPRRLSPCRKTEKVAAQMFPEAEKGICPKVVFLCVLALGIPFKKQNKYPQDNVYVHLYL